MRKIFVVQCHPQNIFNIELFPNYAIWLSPFGQGYIPNQKEIFGYHDISLIIDLYVKYTLVNPLDLRCQGGMYAYGITNIIIISII